MPLDTATRLRPTTRRGVRRPRAPRWLLALHVFIRRASLDGRLAVGVEPSRSDALWARAGQLMKLDARRQLAAGLETRLDAARDHRAAFTARAPLQRRDLIADTALVRSIVDRLHDPVPVTPRGMARLRMLLVDGTSPMYHPAAPDALHTELASIRHVLEPSPR